MNVAHTGVIPIRAGWLFIINEVLASWGLRRVYYAEELDVAFVDVVGPTIPHVERLHATVPLDFDRVEVHFVPDRFGGGPYETVPAHPEDCLMVRGSLTFAHDVMLPPLARC